MTTMRLGVCGYPIKHSLSPAIHQAALDTLGIDARYERWEIRPEQLQTWVAGLRAPDILGSNITVPHKEAVIPFLDELTPLARAIGAVNTIVHREGRLIGDNTDAAGFVRSLREEGGFEPQGRRLVLLGAGGAARAIAAALAWEGAASIAVHNRGLERAERLAAHLGSPVRAFPLTTEALAATLPSAECVVNTTSAGLREGETPLPAGVALPPGALVVDIIYNPPRTRFLREAEAAGARTLGGLGMLVYQAAASFTIWTGREAPVAVMYEAARRALAARSA